MRHSLSATGFGYRLRPVGDADAEKIVDLRGNPALNRFIHRGAVDVAAQLRWLEQYYARAGDYYFVVERLSDASVEGLIALYDVDAESSTAEWGRWILRPNSLAAVESAYLIYSIAFQDLHLDSVYCRTVSDNAKVASFHSSCGLEVTGVLHKHFELDGNSFDAVEHRLTKELWRTSVAPHLERLSRLSARRASA